MDRFEDVFPAASALTQVSVPRRALDVVLASAALLVLSPVLAAVAVLVRLTSPGPALFRQRRIGEGGREFTLYKFRTMRSDAAGPLVCGRSDERLTAPGGWLRHTYLDELPQFYNVLRGDMTLVGPRPETPELARRYHRDGRWIFAYRPGLTGPFQLTSRERAVLLDGRSDPEEWYLTVVVPRRIALDAEYLAAPTLANTVRLLARTVPYVLAHAHHGAEPAGRVPLERQ